MTYVVVENCIKCKYTDCVEVCPVDCFYEGENMLVIHPDECIDCGVCEPECPAECDQARHGQGSGLLAQAQRSTWPRTGRTSPRSARRCRGVKEMDGKEGKLAEFSANPGRGRLKSCRQF